jgi:hypothetical protein
MEALQSERHRRQSQCSEGDQEKAGQGRTIAAMRKKVVGSPSQAACASQVVRQSSRQLSYSRFMSVSSSLLPSITPATCSPLTLSVIVLATGYCTVLRERETPREHTVSLQFCGDGKLRPLAPPPVTEQTLLRALCC